MTFSNTEVQEHVRLPCSRRNVYRRRNRPGRTFSRWYLTATALRSAVDSPPRPPPDELAAVGEAVAAYLPLHLAPSSVRDLAAHAAQRQRATRIDVVRGLRAVGLGLHERGWTARRVHRVAVGMVVRAGRVANVCPQPIALLRPTVLRNVPGRCAAWPEAGDAVLAAVGSVTLTSVQVVSLLCNAFLCTFPKQQLPADHPCTYVA
jgi:hypothetical protein